MPLDQRSEFCAAGFDDVKWNSHLAKTLCPEK